jgi:hypothetical protein
MDATKAWGVVVWQRPIPDSEIAEVSNECPSALSVTQLDKS